MKKYFALLFLMNKIMCGNDTYDKEDVKIAKKFKSIDGLDFLAGLTTFGLSEKNPEIKSGLVFWFLGDN